MMGREMPPGRPSIYSDELANEICERLAAGEPLTSICRDDEMPGRTTVLRWAEDKEEFGAKCARARVWQAYAMADRIIDVADASTPETAQSDKVKISAYQWTAAKLAPRNYGDKIEQTLVGPGGGAIEVKETTAIVRAKAVLALISKAESDAD